MSNAPSKPVSFSRPKVGYFSNRPRMSLCVDDRLVCRSESINSDLHTRRSSTQRDIYQVSHWYKEFSWWWAHGCLKHVENRNKQIRKNCLSVWFIYKDCCANLLHKVFLLIRYRSDMFRPQFLAIFRELIISCSCYVNFFGQSYFFQIWITL